MVDTTTARVWQFAEELREDIPASWRIRLGSAEVLEGAQRAPDAVVTIEGPDGSIGKLLVEVMATPSARAIEMLSERSSDRGEGRDSSVLVLSDYLSAGARAACDECGLNYADATGALSIRLDCPALFIRQPGAKRNPRPRDLAAGSLRGQAAGRLVRALVAAELPMIGKDLAALARVRPSTASRTLTLIEREGLLEREVRGPVTWVDMRGLILRWAEDMKRRWRRSGQFYLAPGGSDSVLRKLRGATNVYALSGTAAANEALPLSASPRAVIYTLNTTELARTLELRRADERTANVILQGESEAGLLGEVQSIDGLSLAPWSQVAADCLAGSGRDPSVGEMLLNMLDEQDRAPG